MTNATDKSESTLKKGDFIIYQEWIEDGIPAGRNWYAIVKRIEGDFAVLDTNLPCQETTICEIAALEERMGEIERTKWGWDSQRGHYGRYLCIYPANQIKRPAGCPDQGNGEFVDIDMIRGLAQMGYDMPSVFLDETLDLPAERPRHANFHPGARVHHPIHAASRGPGHRPARPSSSARTGRKNESASTGGSLIEPTDLAD